MADLAGNFMMCPQATSMRTESVNQNSKVAVSKNQKNETLNTIKLHRSFTGNCKVS